MTILKIDSGFDGYDLADIKQTLEKAGYTIEVIRENELRVVEEIEDNPLPSSWHINDKIKVGKYALTAWALWIDEKEIAITANEFRLLRTFMAAPNRVLPADYLLEAIYQEKDKPHSSTSVIRNLVFSVRQKGVDNIVSRGKLGYCFVI